MLGVEQRTKDRDGAPVECRGVPLRAAGVALPATWLAQTAETAQTSKTSMKWASVRGRISPRELAQIAETSRRSPGQPINMWCTNFGLLENAKTGITEKGLESPRPHKILRVSPFPTARRFARTDMNSNPWWIDLHPNTNESKNAGGNSGITESPTDAISCVVRPGLLSHSSGPFTSDKVSGNCGNGANLKNLDKMGIDAVT